MAPFGLGGGPFTGSGLWRCLDLAWLGAYDYAFEESTRADVSVALCGV